MEEEAKWKGLTAALSIRISNILSWKFIFHSARWWKFFSSFFARKKSSICERGFLIYHLINSRIHFAILFFWRKYTCERILWKGSLISSISFSLSHTLSHCLASKFNFNLISQIGSFAFASFKKIWINLWHATATEKKL